MRQRYKIDGSEIKRILEMHDRENPNKRLILEQDDKLKEELQTLLDNKCFPRGEVVGMNSTNPKYKYAIKLESKKTPGRFRYFFIDKTAYEYDDDKTRKNFHRVKSSSGADATWECDKTDLNSRIADFKKTGQGGGWMTYDEANTIDPVTKVKPIDLNPDGEGVTWEQTTFEGKKFYRAKRGENSACPKYDELVSKRQKDFVDKIKGADVQNATWLLCGDLKDATNQYDYVPYKIPNSEVVFPGGLTMYRPKSGMVKDADKTQKSAEKRIKSNQYNRKECKKIIQTYWNDFKQSEFGPINYEDKINAQSCVRQYYDNWGGLFSGEKNYDNIIDVLTCVTDEYEGQRQPNASQPCIDNKTKKTNPNTWRLCPKNYYS
jgi:hypothetical protein